MANTNGSGVSKLMQSLLSPEISAYKQLVWQPPVDVYEDENGWIVKIELAGVQQSDVNILVSGSKLIIEGLRRDYSVQNCQRIHSMEISYNRFRRIVDFPCDVEHGDIETEYKDGMLFVRLLLEKNNADRN